MNSRHEMYRGREVNGELCNLRLCGYAFKEEDEAYYKLSLMLFPNNVYFLSKNKGEGYTIFSKATQREDGSVGFQNPVGFAKVQDHIRTHLYVRFPDLGSHMYMSLFPTE